MLPVGHGADFCCLGNMDAVAFGIDIYRIFEVDSKRGV
jgi:hypothetical protein